MNIQIDSTNKIVQLSSEVDGWLPARVWEGHTGGGVKVAAFITRIVCLESGREDEFERALKETRPPSPEVHKFDARLIL